MDEKISLKVTEAAKRAGLGIGEIYTLAKTDPTFPAFKVGRKIVIDRDGFDRWFANLAKRRIGFKK